MTSRWKDGDWCFYEFKLCQIVVKDGKVKEATDGMFRTSGQDLSYGCAPLSLHAANLTQHAQHWSDRLHKEGPSGLNYPDIHRKLADLWMDACIATERDEQKEKGEAISKFAQAVLASVKNVGEVDGIPLFRRHIG